MGGLGLLAATKRRRSTCSACSACPACPACPICSTACEFAGCRSIDLHRPAQLGRVTGASYRNQESNPLRSAPAGSEQPVVEPLLDGLGNLHLLCVRMLGIQQVVPSVGNNGGGTRASGVSSEASQASPMVRVSSGCCFQSVGASVFSGFIASSSEPRP